MFNFAGITHIVQNPDGHAHGYNFSLVGSVPAAMMEEKPATRSDVMGGRAYYAADGAMVALRGRQWETVDAIIRAADKLREQTANDNAVRLCDMPNCACRLLGF